MIEWLSRSIAVFLCKEKVITEEDRCICQYGIEVILANMTGIIIIILIGIFSNYIWQGVIFLLLFGTLRIYTGGYHADTYLKCNLYFAVTFVMTLWCFNIFCFLKQRQVLWFLVLAGFLIVGALAPIENKNKRISDKEKGRYQKISVIIYALMIFIMLVGDRKGYKANALGISMPDWYDLSLYIKIVLCSIVVLMLFALDKRKYFNTKNVGKEKENKKGSFKFNCKGCDNNS